MAVKPNDDFEKYGDLKTFEPSLRQKHSDVIADYLESMGVASTPQTARDMAEGLTGSNNPSYGFADMMGVADFTPAGLIYAADEVKTGYEQAKKGTDYIIPTLVAGVSALEAYPLTRALTTPVKRFIQRLGDKSANLPTDAGRRDAVKKIAIGAGTASIPGAGALKLLDAPTSPGPKAAKKVLTESKAQRALVEFAKKEGGVDKDDMLAVANFMKTNPNPKDLSMMIRAMDSYPRDGVLQIIQKNDKKLFDSLINKKR